MPQQLEAPLIGRDETPDRAFSAKPGVLVIDDEHMVRSMLQLGLERSGFNVWVAADGRAAIECYRENRDDIAVVLIDVRMPGLDGPATLDRLRELNVDVVACFMTGDMGAYHPEDLMRRGAVYVIPKPFQFDAMAGMVRLLAHGKPAHMIGHAAKPGS